MASDQPGANCREKDLNLQAEESLDCFIDRMALILEQKLYVIADSDRTQNVVSCINEEVIGHSCDTSVCMRLQLPELLRDRVTQLITPEHFHLGDGISRVLRSMRDQVPGMYDLVIVTAVSSNHFDEMKSMISNVRVNLLPHLKNFTFIVYNLGLEDSEASLISSNCDCHVVDFPFDQLSPFMGFVKCYTWKPLIVSAHIAQTNLLLWADASIRFHQNVEDTISLLNRARTRGLQVGVSHTSIAHVTLQPMFQFFGDEACTYLPYKSSLNAIIVFHNEEFVRRVILEPWTACAINNTCMCPGDVKDLSLLRVSCHELKGKYDYGICHRFDQSALSIIGTKLYQNSVKHVFLDDIRSFVDIKRGDKTTEKGAPFYRQKSP